MPYKPTQRVAEILDWCYWRIQQVPYSVTTRWLFYRFIEEKGFAKKDYGRFKKWISVARKRNYKEWRPDTLEDDTREIILRGGGYESWDDFLEHFKREICVLEVFPRQERLVQIWFEAQAMKSQFNYFTSRWRVTLVPFRGDASIDQKYKVANELKDLWDYYMKPIVVLYFGDYDPKGLKIPESALRDIRAWSQVPFTFMRCGINQEHIDRYNLIENPERPRQYQWEALPESAAEELILGNLQKFWDLGAVEEMEKEEEELTARWLKTLEKAAA